MQLAEPKTLKSKHTKARILAIAKHVFEKKGFQRATVKDITTAADLGYGTFYLYFKDKKDVFIALIEQVEDELFTVAEGGSDLSQDYERGVNSYRALRKDLKAILKSFLDNASILKFSKELALLDGNFRKKYDLVRSRLLERTKRILEKSGLTAVNLDVAAVAISGMIESVATDWSSKDATSLCNKFNEEEVLPTLTKLYFKAVS